MSFPRRCVLVLVLVLGSVGVTAPASAATIRPHPISIAHARTLPLGSVVTVSGTATTPSGWLESSSFDKGFGLQDHSAGIYVSTAVNPNIVPRDKVRVTGQLQESFGLLVLVTADPTQIKVGGTGPAIRPVRLATGTVGEASEGRLARVVATITQAPVSDLPYGYKFLVDDGSGEVTIFVSTQPGIDLSRLAVGKTVKITGFSGQFDTHYEIIPRFPSDIAILAG
jgi:hypothetical protein